MLLEIEAACLAALTVLFVGPVSARLARASWPSRAPRAALVLWQAIGLGGGLGVLTAGLTLAAAAVGDRWLAGVLAVPTRWGELGFWGWFGVALTGCVGAYLVSATVGSTVRMLAARRAHRHRLDLVSTGTAAEFGGMPAGDLRVRFVDHPHAVAYCLPGFRPRVVLSHGALDALTAGELRAVLRHEQAHVRGHHDLVIQPFIAWAQTFPFLRPAREAVNAVSLLVEMLADDAALARCGHAELTGALRRLSDQHLAVVGGSQVDWRRRLDARVARLASDAPRSLARGRVALVYAVALLLVFVPPVVLLLS